MNAPERAGGVRASDAERERVAEQLQRAAAEGRLSPEEAGERLAAASTAKYWDDLNQLIADLPVERSPERVERTMRPGPGAWWLWRVARLAVVVLLVTTFWGFWGVRLLLWPLGFMALAFLTRPWRRRRWRRFRARGWGGEWGVATDPGSRS